VFLTYLTLEYYGIRNVDFRLAATCDLLAAGLMNMVLTRINVRHAVAVSNLVS